MSSLAARNFQDSCIRSGERRERTWTVSKATQAFCPGAPHIPVHSLGPFWGLFSFPIKILPPNFPSWVLLQSWAAVGQNSNAWVPPFPCCKPPASCFDVLVSERHLPTRNLVTWTHSWNRVQTVHSKWKIPVQLASCDWTGGWVDDDPPDCGDNDSRDWSVSTYRCIPSTLPGM